MTKVVLAGGQKRLSMIAQIIEGQGWYFTPGTQSTLGRSQSVDMDFDTVCREVARECHRTAMTSSQWKGEAKGIRCSRFKATQNPWSGKIDEKYRTNKNLGEGVQ